MKILRIREGKMKLSLSADEAKGCGILYGKAPSGKELCAIVRSLLQNEEEGRTLGEMLAEAYPKTDGSCDIFVTAERGMAKRTRSTESHTLGFSRTEDLAFALYVLANIQRPPSDEETREVPCAPSQRSSSQVSRPSRERREEPLPREVYEFFSEESREGGRTLRDLPTLSIYLTENGTGEGYKYILHIEHALTAWEKSVLSEFSSELTRLSPELLSEHTRRIEPTALML